MHTQAGAFASHCCLQYAMEKARATDYTDFSKRFGQKRVHRGWADGRREVSPYWAHRMERFARGTNCIHALHVLLAPRKLTRLEVQEVLALMRKVQSNGAVEWSFPNDAELRNNGRLPWPRPMTDTKQLVEREDLFGFIALLALIREAESPLDAGRHLALCQDLYRTFPAIARIVWIRPRIDSLCECLTLVVRRVLLTTVSLHINWLVMQRRMNAVSDEGNIDDVIERDGPTYHRPVPLLTGPLVRVERRLPKKWLGLDWLLDPNNQTAHQ